METLKITVKMMRDEGLPLHVTLSTHIDSPEVVVTVDQPMNGLDLEMIADISNAITRRVEFARHARRHRPEFDDQEYRGNHPDDE